MVTVFISRIGVQHGGNRLYSGRPVKLRHMSAIVLNNLLFLHFGRLPFLG